MVPNSFEGTAPHSGSPALLMKPDHFGWERPRNPLKSKAVRPSDHQKCGRTHIAENLTRLRSVKFRAICHLFFRAICHPACNRIDRPSSCLAGPRESTPCFQATAAITDKES